MTFPRFRFLRSGRGVFAVAALLLVLFLFRPGVRELRNRIAGSIGSALGRRVEIDNVRLRFFPRPGFDLEGLVIFDDPIFSPEPMMRAQEVSAAIRFRSLLRGRLEIATLSATDPSINLVRNNDGRWNLASLLERNARIPATATDKPASTNHPSFPYLEATGARVNIKIGQTKKAYTLMDADVALWQDSDNSWGARMKAQPVRTDFNLTDTGLVQIDATWQRAESLRLTPLRIAVRWRNGQLGQITKLFTAKDRGWRGAVDFTASLSGTPEALGIESKTLIEHFHRFDIADNESVALAANCSGQYDAVTAVLSDLLCQSPVSTGKVQLRGGMTMRAPVSSYDLALEVEKVPLSSALHLLRQSKRQIPSDLVANGVVDGAFRATRDAVTREGLPRWTGTGMLTGMRLSSSSQVIVNGKSVAKEEIAFGTIPLALSSGDTATGPKGDRWTAEDRTRDTKQESEPAEPHLRIGPVSLTVNASAPVNAGGWLSAAGYRFNLRGDLELKSLFVLEDVLGLPFARPAAEGLVKVDASVLGPWQGFTPPLTIGSMQMKSVRAETIGFHTPIEITSANLTLTPDSLSMQKIVARTGNTHWTGSVVAPRRCGTGNPSSNATRIMNASDNQSPTCPFVFDLSADQLSLDDLADWFTTHSEKRPWYRILSSAESNGPSPLLALNARGDLHVARFLLKKVAINQVNSRVEVDRGSIAFDPLTGHLLHGTYQGRWKIEAGNQPVQFGGSGTWRDISLQPLAASTNEPWLSGIVDGKYEFQGTGDIFHELLPRSDGNLQFLIRNASWPRVDGAKAHTAFPVRRFSGDLALKQGAWAFSSGRLESRDDVYQVSGTASATGVVDLVLSPDGEAHGKQRLKITGTLAKPEVAPGSSTTPNIP